MAILAASTLLARSRRCPLPGHILCAMFGRVTTVQYEVVKVSCSTDTGHFLVLIGRRTGPRDKVSNEERVTGVVASGI